MVYMLYFKPFWSNSISLLEKGISVLLITLSERLCCGCGVSFCASVRFCSFLSRVLYLELMSLQSFSSIVCCMCGHQLP